MNKQKIHNLEKQLHIKTLKTTISRLELSKIKKTWWYKFFSIFNKNLDKDI